MKELSFEEIQRIPDLLLSPDERNVLLALELLEHHPYVIPQILSPIEVYLACNEAPQQLLYIIKQTLPNFNFEASPLYIIYNLIKTNDIPKSRVPIERFIKKEAVYRKWLLADPSKAVLYANTAQGVSFYLEFREQALMYHRLAIKYAPNNFESYIPYINTLKHRRPNNFSLADCKNDIIASYNKAYAISSKEWVLHDLALFYQNDLKDIAQTRKAWNRCTQLPSPSHRTLFAAARFYAEQKEWTVAKQLATQSLSIHTSRNISTKDETYYLLGNIERIGFKNLENAELNYIQAITENEFYMEPLEALMELSLEKDDYNKAIQWHKLYLQHYPLDILLMQTIGDLYLKIYDLEEAARYYTDILDLNAAYPPALESLKKIQQL